VTFNKESNTVHYTGESRNVIEPARNSVAGEALFNRIKTVKWTRGTGGVLMTHNAYAAEEGHGDNASRAYGPIGAAQEPSSCEEYTDSKGHRVTRYVLHKLQQELWDAPNANSRTGWRRRLPPRAAERQPPCPTGAASPPIATGSRRSGCNCRTVRQLSEATFLFGEPRCPGRLGTPTAQPGHVELVDMSPAGAGMGEAAGSWQAAGPGYWG